MIQLGDLAVLFILVNNVHHTIMSTLFLQLPLHVV